MSVALVCLAALLLSPLSASADDAVPIEISGVVITSRCRMMAWHPSGLAIQSGGTVAASWSCESQRVSLGLSSISRRGGCCALAYADVYLINGFACGAGIELSRAGLRPVLEVVWYPIDGVQVAWGLDTVRGMPFVWFSRTRE
jgi:hypothetical protein